MLGRKKCENRRIEAGHGLAGTCRMGHKMSHGYAMVARLRWVESQQNPGVGGQGLIVVKSVLSRLWRLTDGKRLRRIALYTPNRWGARLRVEA